MQNGERRKEEIIPNHTRMLANKLWPGRPDRDACQIKSSLKMATHSSLVLGLNVNDSRQVLQVCVSCHDLRILILGSRIHDGIGHG